MRKLLLLVLLLPSPLFATVRFLNGAATGTGTGATWANAYATTTAMNTASSGWAAGDVICMAGGTYTGQGLVPGASGTSGSPITYKRATASDPTCGSSTTGWNSAFDSLVTINGGALLSNGLTTNYITVDGMVANGILMPVTNGSGDPSAFGVAGPTTGVIIRNIEISQPGCGSSGCSQLGDSRAIDLNHYNGSTYDLQTNMLIDHAYLHGQCTILWTAHSTGLIIQYSKFADSIDTTPGNPNCHPNVIAVQDAAAATFRYNEVTNWQVEGILSCPNGACSSVWDIYGNVWHDPYVVGGNVARVFEAQGGSQGPIHNYNNTYINSSFLTYSTANGGSYSAGSAGLNNIYYASATAGLPSNDYDACNGSTCSETHGQSITSAIFTNYAGGVYTLASDTAAGSTLSAPFNTDLNGTTRGANGTWDRGYYQIAGGPTVATPTASLAAGTYAGPQSITLSDSTPSAVICYTTNGTTPAATTPGTCDAGSTTYSTAISVTLGTTTIKAIGTLAANSNSTAFSGAYVITPQTWYIRSDGSTAANCTGHTNAAYPGSGTGQACALLSMMDMVNPSTGAWVASYAGGDVIQYGDNVVPDPIGQGGLGGFARTFAYCAGNAPNCVLPPFPSGVLLTTGTAYSITSGIATITAANTLTAGSVVMIQNMTTGTPLTTNAARSGGLAMNGGIYTVLVNGLSTSQFEIAVTSSDVSLTSDTINVYQPTRILGMNAGSACYSANGPVNPNILTGLNHIFHMVSFKGTNAVDMECLRFTQPDTCTTDGSGASNVVSTALSGTTATIGWIETSGNIPLVNQKTTIAGTTNGGGVFNEVGRNIISVTGSSYSITSTSMTSGTATYNWTLVSGSAPINGQSVKISGTTNGGGVFNSVFGRAISSVTGTTSGTFAVTGLSGTYASQAETGTGTNNASGFFTLGGYSSGTVSSAADTGTIRSTLTCVDGVNNYATMGISMETATGQGPANLTLKDIAVDGIASNGIRGSKFNTTASDTFTQSDIYLYGNGDAGWNADDGSCGTSCESQGVMNSTHITSMFNGCNEVKGGSGIGSLGVDGCADQIYGGYGDGIVMIATKGNWYWDYVNTKWNTQDGMDGLHTSDDLTASPNIFMSHIYSEGNEGQSIKAGGANATVVNSIGITDCSRLTKTFAPNPLGYNAAIGNYCRANDAMAFAIADGHTLTIQNVTNISDQGVTWDFAKAGSGNCTSSTSCTIIFQNNTTLGFPSPLNGAYSGSIYTGDLTNNPFTNPSSKIDHNAWFNVKASGISICPQEAAETNYVCTDPAFTAESSISAMNVVPTSGSPLRGAGVAYTGIPLFDFYGVATTSPPVIGAANYTPSAAVIRVFSGTVKFNGNVTF